ncbi:MAG: hypothetical protein Q8L27_04075 [archaeon]|nr:hypothetical protein [archaeon]
MSLANFLDKVLNFDQLSQTEQVKLVSYFFIIANRIDSFKASDIEICFKNENLKVPSNISREIHQLCNSKPPILVPKGNGEYTFYRLAKKKLDELFPVKELVIKTNFELRELIKKIKSQEQKIFLKEAVECFEVDSRRASVIMTWLVTIDTIFEFILKNKLEEFNSAIQVNGKYKKIIIVKKDDFGEIKENDLIELMKIGRIITKDERKLLDEKLGFRNTCAHPNTLKISQASVMAFIEDLIENIISKFS